MPAMDHDTDVLIVGAGAAGLATAIFAARHAQNAREAAQDAQNPPESAQNRQTPRIVALDGARKIGAKILVSGGGRCNVTNVRVTPADYYGGNPNVIRNVLAAFPETATRAFFDEIGVPLHEEEFGKLFPDSNSARTVVAALLDECSRLNVEVRAEHRVISIARESDDFVVSVRTPDGDQMWRAARVVLATGGLSLPKTGSDGFGYQLARRLGHTLADTMPALDPLLLAGGLHADFSGISHDLVLTLHRAGAKPMRIAGPALWTHFGLSGPAALNVSRFWNDAQRAGAEPRLTANFVDGADFAEIEQKLIDAASRQSKTRLSNMLREWLPRRVAEAIADEIGLDVQFELGRLTRDQRRKLVHALTEWPLPVTGTRGYKFAEVTAGGVPLAEVSPKTMESRRCPGLHLVGEILDVDGRLGGFNFQWAWSSGFVAGKALADAVAADRLEDNS